MGQSTMNNLPPLPSQCFKTLLSPISAYFFPCQGLKDRHLRGMRLFVVSEMPPCYYPPCPGVLYLITQPFSFLPLLTLINNYLPKNTLSTIMCHEIQNLI